MFAGHVHEECVKNNRKIRFIWTLFCSDLLRSRDGFFKKYGEQIYRTKQKYNVRKTALFLGACAQLSRKCQISCVSSSISHVETSLGLAIRPDFLMGQCACADVAHVTSRETTWPPNANLEKSIDIGRA